MPTNVFVCVFIFKEVKGKVFVFFFLETILWRLIFMFVLHFYILTVFLPYVKLLFLKNM